MGKLGAKIDARKALLEARKKGHVEKSKLKWQLRERLDKASKAKGQP